MQHLLYMLAKSEYAWGKHLERFAVTLRSPLKELVLQQSKEEIKHGRILSGAMKTFRLYPRVARETKTYLLETEIYLFNEDEESGYYSPIIGGSKHLKTLRFVLGDKPLDKYDLLNHLAFAQIVELMGLIFYRLFAYLAPYPLNAAAKAIADDEIGHQAYLFEELRSRIGFPRAMLLCAKWLLRFVIISPIALKEFLIG